MKLPDHLSEDERGPAGSLPEMNWDEVDRPGCYVRLGSGELYRIPPSGLSTACLPVISLVSTEGTRLARISDNPAEPPQVLRAVAMSFGYYVNF